MLIRFKNRQDQLRWITELVREGGYSAFRGGVYDLTEQWVKRLRDAGTQIEEVSRKEVEGSLRTPKRETA